MSTPLVTDALWALFAPRMPVERPKHRGGRPRVADHATLTGILFVLQSGIPWEMLPQVLGSDGKDDEDAEDYPEQQQDRAH